MNGWRDYGAARTRSAEAVVQVVKSGDHVVFSNACGEPRLLPGTLAKRAGELRDVKIAHMLSMGECLYCRPEYADSVRHVALFAGGTTRAAIWEGRADYIPTFYSRTQTCVRIGGSTWRWGPFLRNQKRRATWPTTYPW